nr:MAG TPA: hypothetical protein [Caudoviricetes sp.]
MSDSSKSLALLLFFNCSAIFLSNWLSIVIDP